MEETKLGWEMEIPVSYDGSGSCPIEVELGSLVAALSAGTEDELELELALRALVEGGTLRVAIGGDPPPVARPN